MAETMTKKTLDCRINRSKVVTYSIVFILYLVIFVFSENRNHLDNELTYVYLTWLSVFFFGLIANFCLFLLLWRNGTPRKQCTTENVLIEPNEILPINDLPDDDDED